MSASDSVVIYPIDDHIGTLRRLLIDVVDTAIAFIVSLILTLVAFAILSDEETAALAMLVVGL